MSSNESSRVSLPDVSNSPEAAPRPPYQVILVSHFRSKTPGRLVPVDKDSFGDFIGQSETKLPVSIKPPLGSGDNWEFELAVNGVKSFNPSGLLRQVDPGRLRLELWERVRERRAGRISETELADTVGAAIRADSSLGWLTTPEDAAAPSSGGPVAHAGGSILDLVDSPDEARRIEAEIEKLAASGEQRSDKIGAAEGARLDGWLRRLHIELTTIANALLKHPDLRRLETAWRGLKLLVDQLDFRAGVRLSIVDAARGDAVARLNDLVIQPAFAGDIPTPGLILFDYPCENTPVDLAMLDELGRCAAELPVPVAFPVEAGFFGVKTAHLIKSLPNLAGLVDGWQFAKWRALREQPYSRWLVGVLGRFLLRGPHQFDPGAREFTCTEKASNEGHLLWAGGHLAIGVCAARAAATHGWPTRMFGAEAGKMADLPVVPNPADAQKSWGPGDLALPDRRIEEVAAIGLNLLQSIPNKDHCILLGGMTVAKPIVTAEVGKPQAQLEVSLPYQQFSNIAGAWLCEQPAKLHGLPAEEIQKRLLFGLRDLLGLTDADPGDAIMVGAGPAPGDATRTQVQVRIAPPARIVPGGLHIDFGFTVAQ